MKLNQCDLCHSLSPNDMAKLDTPRISAQDLLSIDGYDICDQCFHKIMDMRKKE